MAEWELPILELFEMTCSNLGYDRKYSDWAFVVFQIIQTI